MQKKRFARWLCSCTVGPAPPLEAIAFMCVLVVGGEESDTLSPTIISWTRAHKYYLWALVHVTMVGDVCYRRLNLRRKLIPQFFDRTRKCSGSV